MVFMSRCGNIRDGGVHSRAFVDGHLTFYLSEMLAYKFLILLGYQNTDVLRFCCAYSYIL